MSSVPLGSCRSRRKGTHPPASSLNNDGVLKLDYVNINSKSENLPFASGNDERVQFAFWTPYTVGY
jgi:hypothetical protein